MPKYKKFEDRSEAHWQYTARDKDQMVRAIRKVIRQAIKEGVCPPIDKTTIMHLGKEIEETLVAEVTQNLKEGKYNDFIKNWFLGAQ